MAPRSIVERLSHRHWGVERTPRLGGTSWRGAMHVVARPPTGPTACCTGTLNGHVPPHRRLGVCRPPVSRKTAAPMTGDRCGQPVAGMLIGDARCSTDEQDLNLRRDALAALSVTPKRIDVDHGLTGTNGSGQGCVKRSPPVEPATPSCSPSSTGSPATGRPRHRRRTHQPRTETHIGGSVHDPTDPVGRTSTSPSSCCRCSASNPPTDRASGARSTPSPAASAPAARSSTATPGNDGLAGTEGAFLPCSFWLVQALAATGRTAAAHELLTELWRARQPTRALRRGDRPASHRHLGNYPQAVTDAALLQAAHPAPALTNTTVHGIAGSAWVWPDSAWIAVITSVVISRRRWRRLPA